MYLCDKKHSISSIVVYNVTHVYHVETLQVKALERSWFIGYMERKYVDYEIYHRMGDVGI